MLIKSTLIPKKGLYCFGTLLWDFTCRTKKTDITSNEQIVIYIGRADCTDCFNFEKKLEQTLKECQVELPTYYTSKDRDGENSREMYQLLERFGITSVPAIIVTQNSKLEKRWLDPEKYLDEIQTYIKKMY